MTVIGGLEHGLETAAEDSGRVIEESRPGELVRPGEAGAGGEVHPIEPEAPKAVEPAARPATSTLQKAAMGVAGLGVAAGAILPGILDSPTATAAVQAAALAGTVDTVAADATGLLTTTVQSLTGNPINMAITGAVVVGTLYLLFRR